MLRPSTKPYHTLLLLFVFWCMWLYTEVTEYRERAAHRTEVEAFMHRGDRFTADDGRQVRKDIIELKRQIGELNEAKERAQQVELPSHQ